MPIGGTNGNPFPFSGQPGGFNPQGPGGQCTVFVVLLDACGTTSCCLLIICLRLVQKKALSLNII